MSFLLSDVTRCVHGNRLATAFLSKFKVFLPFREIICVSSLPLHFYTILEFLYWFWVILSQGETVFWGFEKIGKFTIADPAGRLSRNSDIFSTSYDLIAAFFDVKGNSFRCTGILPPGLIVKGFNVLEVFEGGAKCPLPTRLRKSEKTHPKRLLNKKHNCQFG